MLSRQRGRLRSTTSLRRFINFRATCRAVIQEAYAHVSSYQSRLTLWQANGRQGKEPGKPTAGRTFPAMYRDNMFIRNGRYCARIKVFIRNTWDWIEVGLRKCDADYISLNCATRKECVPTMRCRGKVWSLDFSFIEEKELGLNNACVCSAMHSDGTVIGRAFLKLPKEKDSLRRALGRIRKAQKQGARKMPRLWARAKGLNDDIAVKTAKFILERTSSKPKSLSWNGWSSIEKFAAKTSRGCIILESTVCPAHG